MRTRSKHELIILFLGDATLFYLALWLTLFLRYTEIYRAEAFVTHIIPFSILFLVWVLAFYAAGLYEKHTLVLQSRLPSLLFYTHLSASAIAIAFFYVIPLFGITPKINLFIFLILSFLFILVWRTRGVFLLGVRKRQNAILIGTGTEIQELYREVNNDPSYNFYFISFLDLTRTESVDLEKEVIARAYDDNVSTIVADMKNERIAPMLPHLYQLIFSGIRFMDMYEIYEEVFDRVPLSLLRHSWFMENISSSSYMAYDTLKRGMDFALAFSGTILSLLIYPFVALAIKLDDGGSVFITQERVGADNKIFRVLKFRSMSVNDAGLWPSPGDARITRVGRFLRATRIDELPQLFSVLRGDLSLIGPRPDIIGLSKELAEKIPYYTIRNLIKPGLSGWAQIKQDFPPHTLEDTRMRLSYDLYYLKNRSFFLDLKIALKTIRTLLSRTGR